MLEPGSKDVYREINKTSLQDLLEDDPILDLFFKPNFSHHDEEEEVHRNMKPKLDSISMALTLSNLSLNVRQCSVNELYNLANADSNDLSRRFNLDVTAEDEYSLVLAEGLAGSSSSLESGASVKMEDLYDDEDESIEGTLPRTDVGCDVGDGCGIIEKDPSASTLRQFNSKDETNEMERKDSTPRDAESKSVCSDIGSDSNSGTGSVFLSPQEIIDLLDPILSPFRSQITKSIKARSILDKVRYIYKAVQGLNNDISPMYGKNHASTSDDLVSMLVLSLANIPEELFVSLYSNLRLLMDILPLFLNGSLYDYSLVSLFSSYDYLLNRNVCQRIVKRYAASFKIK